MKFLSSLIFTVFILLLFTQTSFTQITIQAPPEISAGSDFELTWSGPNNKHDFISIAEVDMEDRKYRNYVFTKRGEVVTFRAPDEPGPYELRYIDGATSTALVRVPITILETTALVEAPPEVVAGSEFKVVWTGPDNRQDFITIIQANADEGKYKNYTYTKRSKKDRDENLYVNLKAPDVAGSYEVRYLSGQKYYTLGRTPITVTASNATLEAPSEVSAGSDINIHWTGPDNHRDFITIIEADAEEGKYGKYSYLNKSKQDRDGKSYITLNAPDEAGYYEIRYLTAQSYKTLARIPLNVTSTAATIEVQDNVSSGSKFKVFWTGPGNDGDFITIVPVDAEEGTYKNYTYTKKSKKDKDGKEYLILSTPEEIGDYEVRYLTGQKYITLARTPITLTDVTATLDAPDQIVSYDKVTITWTGPGNDSDFIAIYDGNDKVAKLTGHGYIKRGNPIQIRGPKEPGTYELRYVTGQQRNILARKTLEVVPSNEPGTLKILAGPGGSGLSSASIGAVELILDASGSMLKKINGTPRIDIAKNAVVNLIMNSLEPDTPFALRVFGHMETDSCRTDLEIPLNPLDKTQAVSKVKSIQAKNLAKTPIGKSLSKISDDLAGIEGKTIIILVTDGEETCDGDPKKEIQNLKDQGYDVRVNIVGFAIDELMLKETFREWARVGGGSYFDASDAEELADSIQKAVEIPYEVINQEGDVVVTGVLNGDPVSIPAGTYNVNVFLSPVQNIHGVVIKPEIEKVFTLEE